MDGRAGSASPSAPTSATGAKLDAAGGSGGGEVLGAANGAVMTPSASVGAAMDTLNADADASHEDDERVEGSDDDDQVEGGVHASVEEGEEMDDEALARMLQQQEHAYMMLAQQQLEEQEAAAQEAGEEEDEDARLARELMRREIEEHTAMLQAQGGLAGGEYDGEGEFTDDDVEPDDMTYEQLTALGEMVGTQSKGAGKDALDALKVATYAEVRAGAGGSAGAEEGDEQCAVCRCEFEPDELVKCLPCKHYFHVDCIDQWLKDQKTCPLCFVEIGK